MCVCWGGGRVRNSPGVEETDLRSIASPGEKNGAGI